MMSPFKMQEGLASMPLLVSLLCLFCGSYANAAGWDCTLSAPIILFDKDPDIVTLQQVVNVEEGTFTMKLNYTGGNAYVGIGVNTDGGEKMTPANAVIGRAYDDAEGTTTVMRYDLMSDEKDGSGVVPLDTQYQDMLKDATFEQPDLTTSILTFTQPIDDGNLVVTPDSKWLFAVGLPDNMWEGKHKIHGAFSLGLTPNCVAIPDPEPEVVVEPEGEEPEETTTDTGAETDAGDTDQGDNGDSVQGGDEPSGEEVSSPGTETSNSAASAFTEQANNAAGGIQFFDTSHPNRRLWAAHGIILAIAWGICAPLGIGASLVKGGLIKYVAPTNKGLWYQIHFYLNVLTVVLTAIGFLLGVVATQMEEDEKHFTGDVHHKAGLVIFILCLFQGVFGYFRPGLPKAPPASTPPATPENKDGSEESATANDTTELSFGEMKKPAAEPEKSSLRVGWEYSHRLLGMILLGLSWYNCHTGIEWMVQNWEDQNDLTGAFWGVTGGISGMVFLLAYVIRV